MALFDIDDLQAALGYRNIRKAEYPIEAEIKAGLEDLWAVYEPYADANFVTEFSKQPDNRFWEMYLTVQLLRCRKKLLTRDELPRCKNGDKGPDVCVRKGSRRIWIEAIAPSAGDAENISQVPDLIAANAVLDAARRQVELRITSSLYTKLCAFEKYRQDEIIQDNDSCIVAISAAHFPLQAVPFGLPYAVSAVYPFGQEQFIIANNDVRNARRSFAYAGHIERRNADPIPRTAFQHDYFNNIAGLIWSRRSIGSFLGQKHDLIFVHNQGAVKPIPRAWARWAEEYVAPRDRNVLQRFRRG